MIPGLWLSDRDSLRFQAGQDLAAKMHLGADKLHELGVGVGAHKGGAQRHRVNACGAAIGHPCDGVMHVRAQRFVQTYESVCNDFRVQFRHLRRHCRADLNESPRFLQSDKPHTTSRISRRPTPAGEHRLGAGNTRHWHTYSYNLKITTEQSSGIILKTG